LLFAYASFLLDVFFDPEDGGNMFLWNGGWLYTDYTALYSWPTAYVSAANQDCVTWRFWASETGPCFRLWIRLKAHGQCYLTLAHLEW
jgi:hypothetical protein